MTCLVSSEEFPLPSYLFATRNVATVFLEMSTSTLATTSTLLGTETSTSLKKNEKHQSVSWRNLGIGAMMNIFQGRSYMDTPFGRRTKLIVINSNYPRPASGEYQDLCICKSLRDSTTGDCRDLQTGPDQRLLPGADSLGMLPQSRHKCLALIDIQAWLEASTKGAILVLASSETQFLAINSFGIQPVPAAVLGGVVGGAAQSYLTMGLTTCMKTVEVTRQKSAHTTARVPTTIETFMSILRSQGIRGVNKGVNAVALRQITGWATRMGTSRFAETQIRTLRGRAATEKLGFGERVVASTIGGALSCWNQPFEVIRVDMQAVKAVRSAEKPTMVSTARLIWRENGLAGFFRGVVPRIGLASWATVCMLGMGDLVKERLGTR